MMTRLDGTGIETPIVSLKPRGERLTDGQVKQLNETLWSLLLETGMVSMADAARVMRRRVSERQAYRARKKLAPIVSRHGVAKVMERILSADPPEARHAG